MKRSLLAPPLVCLLLLFGASGCRGVNESGRAADDGITLHGASGTPSDLQGAAQPLPSAPMPPGAARQADAGYVAAADAATELVGGIDRPTAGTHPRDMDDPPTRPAGSAPASTPTRGAVTPGSATEGSACGGSGAESSCGAGLSCCSQSIPCPKVADGSERHLPATPCGSRSTCVRAAKCPPSAPRRL